MPLITTTKRYSYGTGTWMYTPSTYCQNNTSASDYGKCYNIIAGKAVFVQTDTSTYPSLPCETDGTCTRYTNTTYTRTLLTIFDYPGKQAILQYFWSRSHSSIRSVGNIIHLLGVPVPFSESAYLWLFPAPNYEMSSWPVYDPVGNWKAYVDPYKIPVGSVTILRWQGSIFTSRAPLSVQESNINNIWYAFDMIVAWAYESSPLAIIPLDYNRDYVPYQELRNVFGYASTGIDQPGWNADDIIRVLKELFPERAWAVFDDRQYVLYLHNLTIDDIPEWLIQKLSPVAIKVLKQPSDRIAALAWLEELVQRNVQKVTLEETI